MRRRQQHGGYTLIELMISIAIGLFIALGLSGIYFVAKRNFLDQDSLGATLENQRFVFTVLTDQVQTAGYYPEPMSNNSTLAFPAAANFAVGSFLFGSGNATAANDSLTIRYQARAADNLSSCTGSKHNAAAAATYSSRFEVNSSQQLICTDSDNRQSVISEDVAGFKVLYLADTDGDAAPDRYLYASSVTTAGLWASIHAVQISYRKIDREKSRGNNLVYLPMTFKKTIALRNQA
ncbi:PilW family protein [Comamonas endophytica]|uniref:PilW family protein n=1 Tax=Comamonas endophytica TaxID=2949090 RepID=A0ABY6G8Y2_9BURK|nr:MULTISPECIES: PilW family protein [unclassified Acidovorax]MCD2511424.1 PilW family protein [Acidovorax sp. D4N7]UYG50815.1 PilW family protein [Acidovorax sp. 5MLIR]